MPKNLPTTEEFDRVSEWVFDLDNTLYPRHTDLFSQIDLNRDGAISRGEAKHFKKKLKAQSGTPLQKLSNSVSSSK